MLVQTLRNFVFFFIRTQKNCLIFSFYIITVLFLFFTIDKKNQLNKIIITIIFEAK